MSLLNFHSRLLAILGMNYKMQTGAQYQMKKNEVLQAHHSRYKLVSDMIDKDSVMLHSRNMIDDFRKTGIAKNYGRNGRVGVVTRSRLPLKFRRFPNFKEAENLAVEGKQVPLEQREAMHSSNPASNMPFVTTSLIKQAKILTTKRAEATNVAEGRESSDSNRQPVKRYESMPKLKGYSCKWPRIQERYKEIQGFKDRTERSPNIEISKPTKTKRKCSGDGYKSNTYVVHQRAPSSITGWRTVSVKYPEETWKLNDRRSLHRVSTSSSLSLQFSCLSQACRTPDYSPSTSPNLAEDFNFSKPDSQSGQNYP